MGNGRIFKMNTPLDIEQNMIPLSSYFIATGFIDMLPTALSMARELNYGFNEVAEARADILAYREEKRYR